MHSLQVKGSGVGVGGERPIQGHRKRTRNRIFQPHPVQILQFLKISESINQDVIALPAF